MPCRKYPIHPLERTARGYENTEQISTSPLLNRKQRCYGVAPCYPCSYWSPTYLQQVNGELENAHSLQAAVWLGLPKQGISLLG
jgi:hypothetical protein